MGIVRSIALSDPYDSTFLGEVCDLAGKLPPLVAALSGQNWLDFRGDLACANEFHAVRECQFG